MSTTRKKNNIFKVILSGVTAAVIIAASAGCGTVDLTMGKNNKNSSDNSVVEVIMPADNHDRDHHSGHNRSAAACKIIR